MTRITKGAAGIAKRGRRDTNRAGSEIIKQGKRVTNWGRDYKFGAVMTNRCRTNIRSLWKNFDNLLDISRDSNYSFNILCITETWCRDSTLKNNTNRHLPNFDIISQEKKIKQARSWCTNLHPQKPGM